MQVPADKPHPATIGMTAVGYVQTGLLLAVLASIWFGVLVVVAAAVLDTIK